MERIKTKRFKIPEKNPSEGSWSSTAALSCFGGILQDLDMSEEAKLGPRG